MTVGNGQIEEVFLSQVSFNAADDQRTVGITNLLGDHADHVGALYPQVESIEAGLVVQFARGGEDSLLCVQRN